MHVRTLKALASALAMRGRNSQVSQMACSQHGRRNAFTANLLQFAQRSLMGMSSGERELRPEARLDAGSSLSGSDGVMRT